MIRYVLTGFTALSLAAAAAAQVPGPEIKAIGPNAPHKDAKAKPALTGKPRIEYILKQLNLNEQQSQHAKGLMETHFGDTKSAAESIDLEQVRQIWKLLEDAQKKGDKEEQERLTQQLRRIGQGTNEEPEFFQNLEAVLTPEQKEQLKVVMARLESNPAGVLRPIDVIYVARRLGLSDEQRGKLDEQINAFRGEINGRDRNNPDEKRRVLLDGFITQVRGILTPEQAATYDKQIEALRPGPGAGRTGE